VTKEFAMHVEKQKRNAAERYVRKTILSVKVAAANGEIPVLSAKQD
jgi:hypothetical protein